MKQYSFEETCILKLETLEKKSNQAKTAKKLETTSPELSSQKKKENQHDTNFIQ